MIVGPDFVWLHFPKCAGTLAERILRRTFGGDPALDFDPLDPTKVIWHENVDEREARGVPLAGKDVICGFRRLPAWVLSRMHFEERRSPHPLPSRAMYARGRFYEEDGAEGWAEEYVRRYSSRPVSHWIRTEHVREDLVAAFSPYLDADRLKSRWRYRRRVNKTVYHRDLSEWFTPGELEALYDSCPTWRDLELALYGNLAVL